MPTATPVKDQFFSQLEQFMEGINCTSYYLVNGITFEESSDNDECLGLDSDEEDENNEDQQRDFTQDQLENQLRIILLNEKRAKAWRKYAAFANPDEGFFNTSTGNHIIESIVPEIEKIMSNNKNSSSDKFDHLFGLTASLNDYAEFWMEDNECSGEGDIMETSINKLGKTWKNILSKTNDELGIDAAYTRPGIERLLEQFKGHCDLQYETGRIETLNIFRWRA